MISDADRAYYRAREQDEQGSAENATQDIAKAIHRRLADLYAEKARVPGTPRKRRLEVDGEVQEMLDMGEASREQGFGRFGCR